MYSEKKIIPMPLRPLKTPHALASDQTSASAVTGWQIATSDLLHTQQTKCGFTKTVASVHLTNATLQHAFCL